MAAQPQKAELADYNSFSILFSVHLKTIWQPFKHEIVSILYM